LRADIYQSQERFSEISGYREIELVLEMKDVETAIRQSADLEHGMAMISASF
jgi:hypothetical protein